jgi:hypothetical protein
LMQWNITGHCRQLLILAGDLLIQGVAWGGSIDYCCCYYYYYYYYVWSFCTFYRLLLLLLLLLLLCLVILYILVGQAQDPTYMDWDPLLIEMTKPY